MNTITRSLHSIFNHRKDIVYRRSSSILISVIRISFCKINLYESPFNIQGLLGLGVAYVAVYVKVSGSSLGKLFFLSFFFIIILNKNRHEEHEGHAMIFLCDKKCKNAIFGQRRWHQTTTALSIPKANTWSILYQDDVTSNVAVHSCNVADVVNERFNYFDA